ncbi:MAG: SAM-dependent methyltransferase [Bacteroidales bacterium]|nr:SAM-dependent methyltransferase [Bacteroidales bacterium]
MNTPNVVQQSLAAELEQLSLDSLSLSAYSIGALRRVTVAAAYYLEIYRFCLEKALDCCGCSPHEMTLVDYGGGHGLLSVFAKRLGFARVIYIDTNADALHTVQQLSSRLGAGPDVALQGDADTLRDWCLEQGVRPQALLAMDVIEHIYVLDDFFGAIHAISPSMTMVFTTASTPFNSRVVRRLHNAMSADEYGHHGKRGFYSLRRDYIKKMHPDMPEKQLDYWAENTRGLTYEDVKRAVESQSPNLLLDPYNTCDPATGSWTERILPVDDYRQLLAPYGFSLQLLPGRYNDHRRGPKEWASRYYNRQIDATGLRDPENRRERRRFRQALKVAPFIYLIATGHEH